MNNKPQWESTKTIQAPPPDEFDVEYEDTDPGDRKTFPGPQPGQPGVTIENDAISNPNAGMPFANSSDNLLLKIQELLIEVGKLRRSQQEDGDTLRRLARSTDRIAEQSTRTADVAQVLVLDRDRREGGLDGLVVLIVEDNEEVLSALEAFLLRSKAAPLRARSAHEAREQLRRLGRGELHAVIVDFVLPDGDGVSLCREIRRLKPMARMIAHTGADDGSIPAGLFHRIVNKPASGAELRDILMRPLAAE